MIERIIEIADTAAFLSLSNGALKIRTDAGSSIVPLHEIQCLILANPAVTVTGALLAELSSAGVMVVISGKNRLPVSMQLPLDANYVQNERFRAQISASVPLNKRLWQTVVKEKIRRQGELLKELHGSDFHLLDLANEVRSGDPDNIEGRAAVIYWKNLFPSAFSRDRQACDNNLLLNYGYAVLRAIAARACCGAGLHPTLGIDHHNRYDPYCLADDIMEPYRTQVDKTVFRINPENKEIPELSKDLRAAVLETFITRIPSPDGMRSITDLLNISASQLADSFQTGQVKLTYR